MTYPIPSYTRVWVRGNFVDLAKAAREETSYGATGPVQFVPSPDVVLVGNQIIDTSGFTVYPDPVTGYFQIQLPSTDDPDLNPVDWTYAVIEPTGRTYNIVVPYDTPTIFEPAQPLDGEQVIDLALVVPNPDPQPGTVQLLVGQTGRGIASVDFTAGDLIVTMTDSQVINVGPHDHPITFADLPTGTAPNEVAIGDHLHSGTYSVPGHTHSGTDVTSGTVDAARLPLVLSDVRAANIGTATYNLNASSAGGNNVDLTATGNPTIAAPTNPSNGQVVQYSVLASGAARTVTIDAAIERLTGVDASYAPASGKVFRLSIRYSGLRSAWVAEAAAVEQ